MCRWNRLEPLPLPLWPWLFDEEEAPPEEPSDARFELDPEEAPAKGVPPPPSAGVVGMLKDCPWPANSREETAWASGTGPLGGDAGK